MRTTTVVLALGLLLVAGAVAESRRAAAGDRSWLDDAARAEATRVAGLFASLSAHLRSSSGDARFAERIPADQSIVSEILADIAFAQHRNVVELPQLVRFAPSTVEPIGLGLAEVRATEYWVTRTQGATGAVTRSDVVTVRYAVRRIAGSWRVVDWVFDQGEDSGAGLPR